MLGDVAFPRHFHLHVHVCIRKRMFAISIKEDNFCDFMFALLHDKPLLKRDLLCKERICSQREQILSLME